MRVLLFLLAGGFALASAAGSAESRNLVGAASVENWAFWSPRPELAHEHGVVKREGANALMLRAKNFTGYGYWLTRVSGVKAGSYYHLSAHYQTEGIREDTGGVFAVISWYSEGPKGRERSDVPQFDGHWVEFLFFPLNAVSFKSRQFQTSVKSAFICAH